MGAAMNRGGPMSNWPKMAQKVFGDIFSLTCARLNVTPARSRPDFARATDPHPPLSIAESVHGLKADFTRGKRHFREVPFPDIRKRRRRPLATL